MYIFRLMQNLSDKIRKTYRARIFRVELQISSALANRVELMKAEAARGPATKLFPSISPNYPQMKLRGLGGALLPH